MKNPETIMDLIRDSKWHEIKEIELKLSMPNKKLIIVLNFLEELSLISIKNEKIMITPKGLKFLELPCQLNSVTFTYSGNNKEH